MVQAQKQAEASPETVAQAPSKAVAQIVNDVAKSVRSAIDAIRYRSVSLSIRLTSEQYGALRNPATRDRVLSELKKQNPNHNFEDIKLLDPEKMGGGRYLLVKVKEVPEEKASAEKKVPTVGLISDRVGPEIEKIESKNVRVGGVTIKLSKKEHDELKRDPTGEKMQALLDELHKQYPDYQFEIKGLLTPEQAVSGHALQLGVTKKPSSPKEAEEAIQGIFDKGWLGQYKIPKYVEITEGFVKELEKMNVFQMHNTVNRIANNSMAGHTDRKAEYEQDKHRFRLEKKLRV